MWFKVDDTFHDHPKTEDALERHPQALTLWLLTGSRISRPQTDGVVSSTALSRCARRAGIAPDDAAGAAAALVASGLWHSSKTIHRCDHCKDVKLPPGAFFFHDWWDCNPCKNETVIPLGRVRWRRKEELRRDPYLREAVDLRDRGQCRYCGVRVKWQDRRGAAGATRDHVDPDGDNSLANVVVACRLCNGRKRDRTPAEWIRDDGRWSIDNPMGGRDLIPEECIGATPFGPGTVLGPTQDGPEENLASRARRAQGGAGRVDLESDLGRAQIEEGLT